MNCIPCRIVGLLFVVAVLLSGCGGGAPETLDPVGSYDAYGAAITADDAVPVLAVATEAGRYVDQAVKVEGVIAEVCQSSGCWLTLAVGPDHPPIRVDVPRDDAGAYVYTFPKDISGRRVVIAGVLRSGDQAAHEHGAYGMGEDDAEIDGDSGADDHAEGADHAAAEAAAMAVNLAIVADGALVERIGT